MTPSPAPGLVGFAPPLAVHNLRAAKVHTHTNTTICGGNRDHLDELVDYIADSSTLSTSR